MSPLVRPRRLNLGCGRTRRQGYIGVDLYRGGAADILALADALPFRDGSFDEVYASHVLEHVPKIEDVIQEIHRILKPKGVLTAVVPYGLQGLLAAPTHIRAFGWDSFHIWTRDGCDLQSNPLFATEHRAITNWRLPLMWHFRKYLGRIPLTSEDEVGRIRSRLPIWRRTELTVRLRKL